MPQGPTNPATDSRLGSQVASKLRGSWAVTRVACEAACRQVVAAPVSLPNLPARLLADSIPRHIVSAVPFSRVTGQKRGISRCGRPDATRPRGHSLAA